MGGVEATYPSSSHAISDGSRIQVARADPDVYGVVRSLHGEYESHAVTASGDLWSLARGEIERHETLVSGEALPIGPTGPTWLSLGPDVQARLEQARRNQAAIELLRAWRKGDQAEQRATWEFLSRALDEDRLSDRKLFR